MIRFHAPSRWLLAVAAVLLVAGPIAASAGTHPLLQRTLSSASAQGKPALVEFYASW